MVNEVYVALEHQSAEPPTCFIQGRVTRSRCRRHRGLSVIRIRSLHSEQGQRQPRAPQRNF